MDLELNLETGTQARELCCSSQWKKNLSSTDSIGGKLKRNDGERERVERGAGTTARSKGSKR